MLKKTTPTSEQPKLRPTPTVLKAAVPAVAAVGLAGALQAELLKREKATRGADSGKFIFSLYPHYSIQWFTDGIYR